MPYYIRPSDMGHTIPCLVLVHGMGGVLTLRMPNWLHTNIVKGGTVTKPCTEMAYLTR